MNEEEKMLAGNNIIGEIEFVYPIKKGTEINKY